MKNIIAAVIAIACIVAGGVGGHFLRSMPGGAASAEKEDDAKADDGLGEKQDDKAAKPDKKDDTAAESGKKDADGKAEKGGGSSGSVVYYKFSREFVVPIIRGGRVQSLVILNLNLEADESISQKLFEMEPKLRDNIMTTLITLSNDGTTFESMTSVENYESIRSMVLMNLKTVVSTGINNVLIVDLAKQDV